MALTVGAVVFGLIAVLALARPGGNTDTSSPLLGSLAPVTAGSTIDGGSFDLDAQRGNWVAVNFFATWCPGCVDEHPELVAFDQWARERGDVELVSVVFNDPSLDQVAAFFAERGGSWPVVDNNEVPIRYGVAQIPETFLVAPSGQVVLHVGGQVTADQLISTIEQLEAGS